MIVTTHIFLVLLCTLLFFNRQVHPATIEEETEAAEIALEDAIIESVKLDFRVRRNDELFITIVTDDGHKLCDGRITGIASLDQITCTFDPELFERPEIFMMTTIYSMTKKEIVSQSPARFKNPSFGMLSKNFKRRLLVRRISQQVLRTAKDKRVWVGAALASGGYGAFVFLYPNAKSTKQPPPNNYAISNFFSKPPSFPPSSPSPSLKRKSNTNNQSFFFSSAKSSPKSNAFSPLFRSSTSSKPSKKASAVIVAKPIPQKKKQFSLTKTTTKGKNNNLTNFQSSVSSFFHRTKQTIATTKFPVIPVKFYLEKLDQSLLNPLFQSLWVGLCVTDYFLSSVGRGTAYGYRHLESSSQAFYQRMRKETLSLWHTTLAKVTQSYLWSRLKTQLSTTQGQMLITSLTTTLMIVAVKLLSRDHQPVLMDKTSWSLPSLSSFLPQKSTLKKPSAHNKGHGPTITTAKVIRKSRTAVKQNTKQNMKQANSGSLSSLRRSKTLNVKPKLKTPVVSTHYTNKKNADKKQGNGLIPTWFASTKASVKDLQEQFHVWPVTMKRRLYVSLTALFAQLCYFSVRKQLDPHLAPHYYHTIQPTSGGSHCLVPFRN